MSIKINLREELEKGKLRIIKFANDYEYQNTDQKRKQSLYLIELLDIEKYKDVGTLIAAEVIEYEDNKVTIEPIKTDAIINWIMNCAENPNAYSFDNFIFPDDEDIEMVQKGDTILYEFEDDLESKYGVNALEMLDTFLVKELNTFFDEALVIAYNRLISTHDFPTEQVIDIEFPIDKTKLYVPKFYLYYKRNVALDDNSYDEIIESGLKKLDRHPKEFTMISSVAMTDYKPEYIEYILEIYTKIKFVNLIRYKYKKMKKELDLIEKNYQTFIY